MKAPLLLSLIALLFVGCAMRPNRTSPVSALPYRDTGKSAALVDDLGEGRTSGPALGTSMQPLYGDKAYLVIAPIAYEELEPGMLVAYDTMGGDRVVHALKEREGAYWTVQGINNPYEDADYVTPQNLIGVVYGTFMASR